jgi:hypothetical protein
MREIQHSQWQTVKLKMKGHKLRSWRHKIKKGFKQNLPKEYLYKYKGSTVNKNMNALHVYNNTNFKIHTE